MVFGLFKKKKKKYSGSEYAEFVVKDIIKETADAITIVFDNPDLIYRPGQFLTLISDIDGEEVRRSYSLCTYKKVDEYPAVTVKRVAGGKMSNYLNEALHVGDTMTVMLPMGNFVLDTDPEAQRHIALFGAGSGITPLRGIARQVLEDEPGSSVTLVYANRDQDSIIFKSVWDKLEAEFSGRLKVIHILERGHADYDGFEGLPNPEMLTGILNSLTGDEPSMYYMCGPAPYMKVVEEALIKKGIPSEKIRKESFTPAEKKNESSTTSVEREIKVILEGEEYELTVKPGQSILEAGLIKDLDMPFSCQSGMCTACRAKCLSGEVSMEESDALTQEEIDEGYVLTCVGHPQSDDVKLDFE
ncbi:ferredoxin--NADP reductase [Marinigracilibium pacificum]|uniref:Ferredoxin--NADP reductase n=1 Tax=Marinigracilibium pacificum TaxID=2729599 RepID=A0A848J4D4_9BACT|nr:ferredoxin--NADP reductase [Marinigracilibium pacificum]NMM49380.1 ferredoxin--NADP reductase [Marinigracilibium pacificum]